MMQHYDRTTITEEPITYYKTSEIPGRDAKLLWYGIMRARQESIIDTDQDQRDQLTTRLSLREGK